MNPGRFLLPGLAQVRLRQTPTAAHSIANRVLRNSGMEHTRGNDGSGIGSAGDGLSADEGFEVVLQPEHVCNQEPLVVASGTAPRDRKSVV